MSAIWTESGRGAGNPDRRLCPRAAIERSEADVTLHDNNA